MCSKELWTLCTLWCTRGLQQDANGEVAFADVLDALVQRSYQVVDIDSSMGVGGDGAHGADADDDVEPSPVVDFGEAAFSLGMPVTVPAGALSVSRRMRSGSR